MIKEIVLVLLDIMKKSLKMSRVMVNAIIVVKLVLKPLKMIALLVKELITDMYMKGNAFALMDFLMMALPHNANNVIINAKLVLNLEIIA